MFTRTFDTPPARLRPRGEGMCRSPHPSPFTGTTPTCTTIPRDRSLRTHRPAWNLRRFTLRLDQWPLKGTCKRHQARHTSSLLSPRDNHRNQRSTKPIRQGLYRPTKPIRQGCTRYRPQPAFKEHRSCTAHLQGPTVLCILSRSPFSGNFTVTTWQTRSIPSVRARL